MTNKTLCSLNTKARLQLHHIIASFPDDNDVSLLALKYKIDLAHQMQKFRYLYRIGQFIEAKRYLSYMKRTMDKINDLYFDPSNADTLGLST